MWSTPPCRNAQRMASSDRASALKPPAFDYHAPRSLDEAVATLAELGDEGKVLAGGQSLVPMLNMRLVSPRALVDIGQVAELDSIEITDAHVRVGALARHARVHRDAEVRRVQPVLPQALAWVAHPVIRNRGTVVGSLVHADPAAELPAALALLDGQVELVSATGARTVAARDYFLGPLESETRPGELAVAARFPVAPPHTGSAVVELSRRHGDYALAGVGVTVRVDGDRRVVRARAAFLGVAGVPVAIELTDALAGQPADAIVPHEAVELARAALDPDADIHATAEYRRHLAGVLVARALGEAAERAVGVGAGPGEEPS
jgi:aerobic carbon-monoxide dehydrogenase medium subunit